MTAKTDRLLALLDRIASDFTARRGARPEPWQDHAVATVLGNVDTYRTLLQQAGDDPARQRLAAGRVSGIRKGVSDLGILDPRADADLIAAVDQADRLATEIALDA